MPVTEIWSDLDGVKGGILINWRTNPLTTVRRIALGLGLDTTHEGLSVFDTDLDQQFFWNGSVWIASGGGGGGDALVANPLSQFAATTSTQLAGVISDEVGTDKLVFNTSPLFVTPRLAASSVIGDVWTATDLLGNGSFQAAVLGGDALTANPLSQFASTTSAELATVINDEVGTDKLVFNTSPLFVTPRLAAVSTIGYIWTATDAIGNGSFQAVPVGSSLSALTAATAINTIDNTTFAQVWDWTNLAGVTGFKFNSVSTAATGNLHKVVQITTSGANATSAQTTYGLEVSNIHTGTTSINIGAIFKASGATTNFSSVNQGTLKVEGQGAGAKLIIADVMGFGSNPKFLSFETNGTLVGDINRPSSGGLTINTFHPTGQFIFNSPSSGGIIYNSTHATTGKHTFTTNAVTRLLVDNTGVNITGITETDQLNLDRTITAAGTTGNQTINKMAGTVNIAAAGTTVTITNSLVTVNSLINVQLRTNDATAWIKNYVAAAGSFIINLGASATAEVSIHFIVTN